MKPLVSVIVPVYNSQLYLHKCIKSILSQTYCNIELILINDGSTDNSLNICRKFEKDSSYIKIIDKKNEGVSSARNAGLKVATGKYCCFVDSDDWISKNYIKNMVNELQNTESQCAVASMIDVFPFINKENLFESSFISKQDEIMCKDFFGNAKAYGFVHGKLYDVELIKKNMILFDENIPVFEDCIFALTYLSNIDYIVTVPEAIYFYNHLTSDSLVSKYYEQEYVYRIQTIKILEKCLKHFISNKNVIEDILMNQAIRCIELTSCHYIIHHKSNEIKKTYYEFYEYVSDAVVSESIFNHVKDYYYNNIPENEFYVKMQKYIYSPNKWYRYILNIFKKLKIVYYFKLHI